MVATQHALDTHLGHIRFLRRVHGGARGSSRHNNKTLFLLLAAVFRKRHKKKARFPNSNPPHVLPRPGGRVTLPGPRTSLSQLAVAENQRAGCCKRFHRYPVQEKQGESERARGRREERRRGEKRERRRER